jgi:hypothetical protein
VSSQGELAEEVLRLAAAGDPRVVARAISLAEAVLDGLAAVAKKVAR